MPSLEKTCGLWLFLLSAGNVDDCTEAVPLKETNFCVIGVALILTNLAKRLWSLLRLIFCWLQWGDYNLLVCLPIFRRVAEQPLNYALQRGNIHRWTRFTQD